MTTVVPLVVESCRGDTPLLERAWPRRLGDAADRTVRSARVANAGLPMHAWEGNKASQVIRLSRLLLRCSYVRLSRGRNAGAMGSKSEPMADRQTSQIAREEAVFESRRGHQVEIST